MRSCIWRGAVEKIAMWDPPMRFNDTTRYYFEKLAAVSSPGRCGALSKACSIPRRRRRFANIWPSTSPVTYSMLHTSISPNIIQGGYQVNVIPSEAEATLDIRALPDEDIAAFYELMRKVINDPAVEMVPETAQPASGAAPSRIDSRRVSAHRSGLPGTSTASITIPLMQTGATDMAFLRAKGVQCYGVGAMVDEEDAPKGYGAHSDQERILEEALYKFLRFNWEMATALAESKR